MSPIDRRMFLAGLAVPCYAAAPLRVLTREEAAVVEAMCDRIIPADDTPGARAAGVLHYIDQQLDGPLRRFAPAYAAGVRLLTADCRSRRGQEFLAQPADDQTTYLVELESHASAELRAFFAMVVDHTMQGFFGAPSHGGNRDQVSWKMLGINDSGEGHGH